MTRKIKQENDAIPDQQDDAQTELGDTAVDRQQSAWNVHAYHTYYVWKTAHQFTPPTDIIELDDRAIVVLEIGGLQRDAFQIKLLKRVLTISGERRRPSFKGADYQQAEIGYGQFSVEIKLPWAVERDSVTAIYRDGLLQIELPRKPETHIHVIDLGVQQDEMVSDDGIEDGTTHHD